MQCELVIAIKVLVPIESASSLLKHFMDILKNDFFRFMVEFHYTGKLTKGINNTFIT